VEWVAEKRAQPMPKRHHLGGGAQIAHCLVALGAEPAALFDISVWHAASAEMLLAFTAMPFGGVAGVIVAIVFQMRLCPDWLGCSGYNGKSAV
jgi:hypothetical protein